MVILALGWEYWKQRFDQKANFDFCHTIHIHKDDIHLYDMFYFHWFPSNKGYHSNISGNPVGFEPGSFSWNLVKTLHPLRLFNIFKYGSLTTCRRNFMKICNMWQLLNKTAQNFLWIILCTCISQNLLESIPPLCWNIFDDIKDFEGTVFNGAPRSDCYNFKIFNFEELP